MPRCELEILVSAYLDGELTPEERQTFVKHLARCPDCQALISELQAVESSLKNQSASRPTVHQGQITSHVQEQLSRSGAFRQARRKLVASRLRDRWLSRPVLTAAALVLLMVAGGLVARHFLWRGSPAPQHAVSAERRYAPPVDILPELLQEVREVLLTLALESSREPGTVRLLQQRVRERALARRLEYAERQLLDAGLRERLGRAGMFLSMLTTIPAERADQEGGLLARAALRAELPAELAALRTDLLRHPAEMQPVAAGAADLWQPANGASSSSSSSAAASTSGASSAAARPTAGEPAGPFFEAARLQLSGAYKTAAGLLEKLSKSAAGGVERPRILLALAQCRAADGSTREALSLLSDPASGAAADEMMMLAARLYELRLNDYPKARDGYQRLMVQGDSSNAVTWAELGLARTDEADGRFAEAVTVYDQVLSKTSAALSAPGADQARSPATSGAALAAEASARKSLIIANSADDYRRLTAFVLAERLAERRETRPRALRELYQLVGLYRDSPLVGDALVLIMRIHLAEGDLDAARAILDRLLATPTKRIGVAQLRAVAPRVVRWLLEEADREVAGLAQVFPELASYHPGLNISATPLTIAKSSAASAGSALAVTWTGSPAASGAGGWQIVYGSNGGNDSQRTLQLRMVVQPGSSESPAGYRNLNLQVTSQVQTNNELLASELRRILDKMESVLAALDQAADVDSPGSPAGKTAGNVGGPAVGSVDGPAGQTAARVVGTSK